MDNTSNSNKLAIKTHILALILLVFVDFIGFLQKDSRAVILLTRRLQELQGEIT